MTMIDKFKTSYPFSFVDCFFDHFFKSPSNSHKFQNFDFSYY